MEKKCKECTEYVRPLISNMLPSGHFSLILVFCLHQKDCLVWQQLLGCSLRAYWWKTAWICSEWAEATRPCSLGNSYYCSCRSCGTQVFLVTLKGNCSNLLHILSAMWPCWLSLKLGAVSTVPVLLIATVKHPGNCNWTVMEILHIVCPYPAVLQLVVCKMIKTGNVLWYSRMLL